MSLTISKGEQPCDISAWKASISEKIGWFGASGLLRLFVYMGAVTQVKKRLRNGQG
jgi:hypothetical protein